MPDHQRERQTAAAISLLSAPSKCPVRPAGRRISKTGSCYMGNGSKRQKPACQLSSRNIFGDDGNTADGHRRSEGHHQGLSRRAAVISWIFFDWAAQPYFTLITTFVFAPYFASLRRIRCRERAGAVGLCDRRGRACDRAAVAGAGCHRRRQRPAQAVDRRCSARCW